jgi:hypothetical protein
MWGVAPGVATGCPDLVSGQQISHLSKEHIMSVKTLFRRIAGIFAAVLALVLVPTAAAFAQVPQPDRVGADVAPARALVSTSVASSGLSPWIVFALVAAALVLGAVATELAHRVRGGRRSLAVA